MSRTCRTVLLCAAVLAVLSPACVKRTISVRSDPPGALVYLDGLEVGRTPVDHIRFHFYGTREIAVLKPGHLSEKRIVEINTPWYSRFPIDLFSELIVPWDIRDRRYYYFALKRSGLVEIAALKSHAHETRGIARARIEGARHATGYKPRAYVVKDAGKRFILWGPFLAPPRAEPVYSVEPKKEEKKEPEKAE